MIELLYGTGNPAKFGYMRTILSPLPIRLLSLQEMPFPAPAAEETGSSPLENARQKSRLYFAAYKIPVFSCDSGLYFEGLPEEVQPGVHVRRPQGKRLNDEEMAAYYAALASRFGGRLTARYRNAVSLMTGAECVFERMDESLSGDPFFIVSKPRGRRAKGFPLDCLSVEIKSGRCYAELADYPAEESSVGEGFRRFFSQSLGL